MSEREALIEQAIHAAFEKCRQLSGGWNATDVARYACQFALAVPPVPTAGWQPIETAPKDGTKVIARPKRQPEKKAA
jgi:hypothetical protein